MINPDLYWQVWRDNSGSLSIWEKPTVQGGMDQERQSTDSTEKEKNSGIGGVMDWIVFPPNS